MKDSMSEARPGEIRIALPHEANARIHFIGRIRTPWKTRADCPKNSREAIERGDEAIGVVELDPLYRAGLDGVATCSHLWILYWMDQAPRDLIVQAPKHLEGVRGVFALRSPARPNPLAMAAVRLIAVDDLRLRVLGLDCLDGTPLVDVKPYFASTDSLPAAIRRDE